METKISYSKADKMYTKHLTNELFKPETNLNMFFDQELYFVYGGELKKIGINPYGVYYLGFKHPEKNVWMFQYLSERYPDKKEVLIKYLNV